MTINRARCGVTLLAILTAAVAACSTSNEGSDRKMWCDANLAKVGAAGAKLGSTFHFGSGADVRWAEYLLDSEVEQGIVVAEAIDGQTVWDAACDQAFVDDHPGASPQPMPSPS